jgi:hypothetical protein
MLAVDGQLGQILTACLVAAACGRTFGGAADATSTTARSTTTTIAPTTTGPRLWGGYLASASNGGIFVQIT